MHLNTISNIRLHCCLVGLILFILIFLSLPLLLIYLANSRYERITITSDINPTSVPTTIPTDVSSDPTSANPLSNSVVTNTILPVLSNLNTISPSNLYELTQNSIISNQIQSINCTEFAAKANLSLANENGFFPCQLCPDICIEQARNCDGIADCPDRSDESSCHDSNGAIGVMFQKIFSNLSNKKHSSNPNVDSALPRSKPDSCAFEQFLHEQCPCVHKDPRVIICEGLGLTSVPDGLLPSVYKIRMSNNSISNIDYVRWPKSLSFLVIMHNRIDHIGRSAFEFAPNLSILYLNHNEISYLDSQAFSNLTELTSLQIEANKLTTFDSRMLLNTPKLDKLYLSENMIDLPEETRFGRCQFLSYLLLDHNRISRIRAHYFSNMTHLYWLSLAHNQIEVIEDGSFDWDYELEELNLSFNKIMVISRLMFARNLNMERLHLSGNPFETLPTDAFREIVQLKSLNLTHIQFSSIQREIFSYLKLDFIYFSKFRYCHYASHVRVCLPRTNGISSKEHLLAFPTLKYAVWIVASVCCLGNVFVFIWRSVSPYEDRSLSLFIRNLSIADLMMGFYLCAIGYEDFKFEDNFGSQAIDWMSSWTCTSIGFLATLSSELSVFILTIITIERYRSITSVIRLEEKTQRRRARVYMTLAWLFALLIALYPLSGLLLRETDYYATNGLCLPLHIDQPFTSGWLYSAFVYLGINFSAVMVIIALYVHMYTMIIDGRQATRPVVLEAEKREDAILAIRFFFIVITDCLCWIPIVVIKVMALANVSISSSIYGWLVVFIIPINSALNPIVYTLAAPTSLRAAVCRLFERVCYRVDLLTTGESNHSSGSSQGESLDPEANQCYSSILNRRRRDTGSTSTTCVVEAVAGIIGANNNNAGGGGAENNAARANPCVGSKNLLSTQVKFTWPYKVNDV